MYIRISGANDTMTGKTDNTGMMIVSGIQASVYQDIGRHSGNG